MNIIIRPANEDKESTCHIAGFVLTIDTRVIQRCALCGAKLIDIEVSNIAVPIPKDQVPKDQEAGDTPFTPGTWEPYALVRVYTGNPEQQMLCLPTEHGRLPSDSCISLIED